MVALAIFSVLMILLAMGVIDHSLAGVYPFDYDKVVMLPRDAMQLIVYLVVVGLSLVLLAGLMLFNLVDRFVSPLRKIARNVDTIFPMVALSVLFVILYALNLDDSHFSTTDSYELMAGALEMAYDQKYSFLHKAAPGASLALIPFLYFQSSEFMAQIAIVIYSALAYVTIIYLWRKVNVYGRDESKYFYVFGLAVIINPMFVAISRTISYEPILILVVSLILLKMYNITSGKYGLMDFIFLWVLLAYTVTLRVNYLIVIVGPTLLALLLYFAWKYIFAARDVKEFVLAFLYIVLVGGSSFALGVVLLPEWAQQGSSLMRIFDWRHFLGNLPATLYVVASSMNTPPSRSLFGFLLFELSKFSVLNITLGLVLLLVFARGVKDILMRSDLRFFGIYIVLLVLSDVLFFTAYEGWQARYLSISILLELFVITKVMYAIVFAGESGDKKLDPSLGPGLSRRVRKLAVFSFALMLMLAVSNSTMAVINWQTNSVRMDNSDQLSAKEFEEIFIYIDKLPGRKIIFTTYEAAAVFYRYKLRADFEVFFVYEFFITHGINNATMKYVLDNMSWYLARNYSVFYLAGWPEIDKSEPSFLSKKFSDFYELLLSNSEYDIIKVGPKTKRQSHYRIDPIYILLAIERIH